MEELNQVQEEGLFDDLADETPAEEPKNETTQEVVESTPAETKESVEEPSFLDIDYLKEVKHLTKDEAKTLAQKGMDYDRIRGRYDEMKQYEGQIETLKKLAKENNLELGDYVNKMSDMQNQFNKNKLMAQLRNENPNADEALLSRLADAELGKTHLEEQTKPDPRRAELEKQVQKFEKAYPNVDWSKLPTEVTDMMNDGFTLLEAYQTYDRQQTAKTIEELQNKVNIKEKNDSNKAKSLGNISSSEEKVEDDFLKGFLSN